MSTPDAPDALLVVAPNWLGDAVMALPLLADVRRAWPSATLTIAARRPVAPLFGMVAGVDRTIVLETRGARDAVLRGARDVERIAAGKFDAALLLPNSFLVAWLVRRAGVPQRWGFARDLRGPLLTRAIPRPRRYGHQVEYYQALGGALGIATGPPYAAIEVPPQAHVSAAALVQKAGLDDGQPFDVFAPGAAYGRAKQWLPVRFAELAHRRAAHGVGAVLVGTTADAEVCREIGRMAPVVDLSGQTDLTVLAAVLSRAEFVVANDSGAMHLAAAAGARVMAIFGPTNEHKTAPLAAGTASPPPIIVKTDVWCRPCMLRECPIDHRCMSRIGAGRVFEQMSSPPAAMRASAAAR